jgi:gentisate 1,2-dioxygenase
VPSRSSIRAPAYPQLRFPWARTERALRRLAAATGAAAEMDYVDPQTGQDVLAALGLTAMFIPAGTTLAPPLRSSSAAFHVISGSGSSVVGDSERCWREKDTFSAPVFSAITHTAITDAFLVRVEDRPLQQKLGYYEERSR